MFLLALSQCVAVETGLLPFWKTFWTCRFLSLFSSFSLLLFINLILYNYIIYTFISAHVFLHVRFINVLLDGQQDYFWMDLFV